MWSRLAHLLRGAGHEVFTPSLTGIGERAHLASASIDLSTHVADVCNVFQYENLSGAVLVGHSYGGMVVTGVADQAAERVRALVYLDAFVPANGQALVDLVGPEVRAALLARDDWKVPPRTPQSQGMTDPQEIAWLEGRRNAQPLSTLTQKISISGRYQEPRIYIFCNGYSPTSFAGFAAKARSDPAWRYHELPTHHYPQISLPRETAGILSQYG